MFGNYPVELIDWTDHHSNRGQGGRTRDQWVDGLQVPCVRRLVGFVIYEDDHQILVACDERGDDDIEEPDYEVVFSIRKELITKRTVLRKP